MTTKNILQKIAQQYFQGIADEISNVKKISSVFPNPSDIGDARENILLNFLKNHLPARCSVVRGGFVFDVNGNTSGQIDLLVINDFAIKFSYFDQHSKNSKNIQTIEGCLAAVSVKSTLNKKELEDGLKNLSSIPQMPKDLKINPMINNKETYFDFPRKIIFSFSGQGVEETLMQINEFYTKNKSFGDFQKADLIVVNNAYCIQKVYKGGGITRDGTIIPEGAYHSMWSIENKENFGALPLLWMIMKIQETVRFTSHILFDYQKYFDSIDFH